MGIWMDDAPDTLFLIPLLTVRGMSEGGYRY